MRKLLSKCMALVALLMFTCFPTFATGRSMTKAEHAKFIDRLMSIMVNYKKKAKLADIERFAHDIDQCTDDFDRGHGFPPCDPAHCTTTFAQMMDIYHAHVANTKAFIRCPLNCRALSLFVIKELMDKDITCFYTSHWFRNPLFPELTSDIHTVVMYKVENAWYICDFANAFSVYIAPALGGSSAKARIKETYGEMTSKDILAIPLAEYQTNWVYNVKHEGGIPAVVRARIDMIGWYPLKFEEYKDKTAFEAMDTYEHFEEMKPDDLEKYYGVRTMEEVKRLFEGKTPEQIKAMVIDRLRSSKS